jgi:hypothetical protein
MKVVVIAGLAESLVNFRGPFQAAASRITREAIYDV